MDKNLRIKISVDKKTGAIKVVDGEFNELSRSVKKTDKSVDGFNKNLKNAVKAGAGLYVIKQAFDFATEVSTTGMRIESMTMSLEAAVGTSSKAKKELDFLRQTTEELGLSFEASLGGFTQFAAAAKQTSLEGVGVENVFAGVSKASAVMGLSVDDQNGVFRALSQMMSKGKIQAEELRGQLGERLPGAFQIAARSMDMTTGELDKFMSSGKLISDDFLPKFGKQLELEFGEKAVLAAQTARAEQNRFNTSLLDMKLAINEAGIDEFTKDFYKLGTGAIKEATHWLHEWNIQANEMRDINKSSGAEVLKEQYVLAIDKLDELLLREKSITEIAQTQQNAWETTKTAFLKMSESEVSHNAAVIKQKALIIKLERTLSSVVSEDAKTQAIKEYKKTSIDELTTDEIKAENKAAKIRLDNLHLVAKKYSQLQLDLQTRANASWFESENKDNAKEKAFFDLTATPEEKFNKDMLDDYNMFEGMFDDKQMERFFDKWNKGLADINKKQKGYEGIGSKDWTAGLTGQAKDIANIGNAFSDLGSEQKKWAKFSSENTADEKDKAQHLDNQLGLYGNIAGAVSNMATEGSAAAQVAQVAQTALAIVQGASAIVNAGTGDPYTAIPRMIAMAAMVAQTLGSAGISGGGGGSFTAPTINQDPLKDSSYYSDQADIAEQANKPILDKFDRQIALLEEISGYGGTTLGFSIDKSSAEYTAQTKQDIISAAELGASVHSGASADDWYSRRVNDWLGYLDDKVNLLNDENKKYIGTFLEYKNYGDNGEDNVFLRTYVNEDQFSNASEFLDFMNYLKDANLLEAFGYSQIEYETILSDFQNATNDFVVSMLSDINSLVDFSSTLKENVDAISGTTKYENIALSNAFSDVNSLLNGSSLTSYMEEQIQNIDALEASVSEADIALLLSSNIDDFQAQQELIAKIQSDSLVTLDNGVVAALNFKDSIDLVAEAMINSNKNIQSFTDSFMNDEQLANEMAKGLGVNVATTMDELAYLFDDLAKSGGVLTDSELSLLDANKSLIESGLDTYIADITSNISTLEGVLGSLSGVIDKLKSAAIGSSFTMDKYYASMSETLSLSGGNNYEDFSKSLTETIGYSSALFDSNNFSTSRDQQFAQLVAAGQFEGMETTALEQIDYLRLIEENTAESNLLMIDLLKSLGAKIDAAFLTEKDTIGSSNVADNTEQWVKDGNVSTWTSTGGAVAIDSPLTSDFTIQTTNGGLISSTDAINFVTDSLNNNDALSVYEAALKTGISANSLDSLMGWTSGTSNDWAISNNLPSFAVGTSRVPYDMIANIHRNEMIIPETFSNDIRNGNLMVGNNNEIISEIKLLREEMKLLRKENKEMQKQIVDNTQESRYA